MIAATVSHVLNWVNLAGSRNIEHAEPVHGQSLALVGNGQSLALVGSGKASEHPQLEAYNGLEDHFSHPSYTDRLQSCYDDPDPIMFD